MSRSSLLCWCAVAGVVWCGGERASSQCQVDKLVAGDGHEFDWFGVAVAVDGYTAVVGASQHTHETAGEGAAYIFEFDGFDWIETTELTTSDGSQDVNSATEVAIHGDVAAIGSVHERVGKVQAGAVYVFRRIGGAWTRETRLTAADAAQGAGFGWSISIDDDAMAISAVGLANGVGATYIFRRLEDGEWVQTQKLVPLGAVVDDNFGSAVSLRGDRLAVGARNHDDGARDAGAVYVFRQNEDAWTCETKLTADDPDRGARFGESVSLDGNSVLVGAYLDGLNNNGAAYVFEQVDEAWVQRQKLVPDDSASNDNFGLSVSLSGDVAVVGAWKDDNDRGSQAGSAYVFARESDDWKQTGKLTAKDGSDLDRFGASLFLHQDTLFVGAFNDDDQGNDSGSAYVFRGLARLDCNANGTSDACEEMPVCPADADDDCLVGFGDLLTVLAAWGPYEPCPPFIPEDIDENCEVDFRDLLAVLANWGPCPE